MNLQHVRTKIVAPIAAAMMVGALWIGLPNTVGAQGPATTMQPMPTTTMPMGDGMLPAGSWTPSQRSYLLNLISRTEAALPAFADPTYLESIGFHDFGAPAPGGYIHYINNSWIDDGRILDPTHPESILFQRVTDPGTGTSHLEVRAAMYFLPTGTTMNNLPDNVKWIPGWHVHPDICVTDVGTFAGLANSDGTCSSGHPMTGPPMTHVWVVDNACGNRFSMVDVAGLMCVDDMDMHDHDMNQPDDSMPNMDDNMDDSSTTMPHMSDVDANSKTAPTAQPVSAQPTFTG